MKARSLIEGSASRGMIIELLELNGTEIMILNISAGRKFRYSADE